MTLESRIHEVYADVPGDLRRPTPDVFEELQAIARALKEISTERKRADDAIEENGRLIARLREVEKAVNAYPRAVTDISLQDRLKTVTWERDRLKERLDLLNPKYDKMRAELATLRGESGSVQSLRDELRCLEKQLNDASERIADQARTIASLQQQIGDYERTCSNIASALRVVGH